MDERGRKVDDRVWRAEPVTAVIRDRLAIGIVPRFGADRFPLQTGILEPEVPTALNLARADSEESAEPAPAGSVPQGVGAG